MLPFTHTQGVSLFPKTYYSNGRWYAKVDAIFGDGQIVKDKVEGEFFSEEAAVLSAAIAAAQIANCLRAAN